MTCYSPPFEQFKLFEQFLLSFMKNLPLSSPSVGAYSSKNARPRLMVIPQQKSRKTGLCKIYMELTVTEKGSNGTIYKQKRIDTEQACLPNEWSKIKEQVKPSNPNHSVINKALESFVNKVNIYVHDNGNSAYSQAIPSEVEAFNRHFNSKNRKTLIEYLEEYIKYRQANSTRGTWKEFRTLKGRLDRYQESRKTILFFENITFEFAEDFKAFAKEIQLDPNTAKKSFEAMSTFLNHYFDDQHKLNFFLRADFRNPKFKKVSGTHSSEPSPLYPDEIKRLLAFDEKKINPTENITRNSAYRVKHLFLLSCFTGLRFSDVLRLSKGSIQNDHIVLRASKTDKKSTKTLFIPLLNETKKILENINYDIDKIKLTNQSANRALTELLKQAGIDSKIKEYSYSLNGERTERDKYKHEVVTFHSGRDTFITNCLIANCEIMTVMSWSGHAKFDTFKKYVALSDSYKKVQHGKVENHFNLMNSKNEILVNAPKEVLDSLPF